MIFSSVSSLLLLDLFFSLNGLGFTKPRSLSTIQPKSVRVRGEKRTGNFETFTVGGRWSLLRVETQHRGELRDLDITVHITHHLEIGLLQRMEQLQWKHEFCPPSWCQQTNLLHNPLNVFTPRSRQTGEDLLNVASPEVPPNPPEFVQFSALCPIQCWAGDPHHQLLGLARDEISWQRQQQRWQLVRA